jgi:hypothetical protein
MSYNQRPFRLAGEFIHTEAGPPVFYEATASGLGAGLVRIDGHVGLANDDMCDFSFVYVPETHDAIVYSVYKLEYINCSVARAECCANVVFSNPYYFEDIGEMAAMAPCVRTRQSRTHIFLRPLITTILGENPLHQLTLPIERFAHYRRSAVI